MRRLINAVRSEKNLDCDMSLIELLNNLKLLESTTEA